jgi:hypothetical protein
MQDYSNSLINKGIIMKKVIIDSSQEKVEDLMLFGKPMKVLAKEMNQGKLSVEDFMNEWFNKYNQDTKLT